MKCFVWVFLHFKKLISHPALTHTCSYISTTVITFSAWTTISIPEYQKVINVINVVNSHHGFMAFLAKKTLLNTSVWFRLLQMRCRSHSLWNDFKHFLKTRNRFGCSNAKVWKDSIPSLTWLHFLGGANTELHNLVVLIISRACKHTRVCLFPRVQTQWCVI